MNLTHLRYFCKLAETENYTMAASKLYISQPGLSGAITSIENELGLKLFAKNGRNIYLTKYGQEFYEHVCNSLQILDQGIEIMHDYSGKLRGNIEIGAITSMQMEYLPKVLADFREQYPNIHVHVSQGQTPGIIDKVLDGKYDVGFCSHDLEMNQVNSIPLMNQKLVAVLNKNHPLAKKEELSLCEILQYPVLSYTTDLVQGRILKKLVDECVKREKIENPQILFKYPNEFFMIGILHQVQEFEFKKNIAVKDAVGLVCDIQYLDYMDDLVKLPVKELTEDLYQVALVYSKNSYYSHALKLFIDFVKEEYGLADTNVESV